MSEWQPIETAPHTGIAILVWQPWKSGRNCQTIAHYANGWVDRDCEELFVDPTHWMPLPDAPQSDPLKDPKYLADVQALEDFVNDSQPTSTGEPK